MVEAAGGGPEQLHPAMGERGPCTLGERGERLGAVWGSHLIQPQMVTKDTDMSNVFRAFADLFLWFSKGSGSETAGYTFSPGKTVGKTWGKSYKQFTRKGAQVNVRRPSWKR